MAQGRALVARSGALVAQSVALVAHGGTLVAYAVAKVAQGEALVAQVDLLVSKTLYQSESLRGHFLRSQDVSKMGVAQSGLLSI